MPNPNVPIITPPRVPLVDPRTGLIDRAWYLFFLSLNNVANAVVDDPALGPSSDSLIASYDAVLQTLAQEVGTQPSQESAISQIAELQNQIQALASQIECPCTELTAELQKQVDGLQLQPAVTFGTMASENIGISGTAVLAKITALGADGSLTFTNGIITAYVAPT
jgi:hypothetical protein